MRQLREVSQKLPGVNSVAWEELSGGPGGKDIELRISGNDFDEIVAVSESLKAHLQNYKGVVDLDDNFDAGLREVRLKLRETAEPTGLSVGQLGQQVRSALYGREARRITRDREDVKIMVRYPEEFRKNLNHLDSMWIPSGLGPNRNWIPLGEVADIAEARSYSTIHRSQQQRSISVLGDVESEIASTNDILNQVRAEFLPVMAAEHPGIRIEFLGSAEEQAKSFSSLKMAMFVSLLVIYTLLAGLFRSYAQPLVVMAAIPFGFQGAVVGHWLTGNPMTIMSMIGMVALTGIVVNDSLVLVDFINTRLRAGLSEFQASVEGAKLRLRAILLTTATTVAGLMPLMFETSFQAKFLIPMAVTLTFGLIFATALTLIIVPSLNMIFFDIRNLFGGGTATPRPQPPTQPREPQFLDDKAPESARPQPKPRPEPAALPRLSET
jgi:multidrug efflux pump subunit AcrB